MPLSIENAALTWAIVPQAPTTGQQAGEGGPAQPLASTLILSGAGAAWNLATLVPTTAQMDSTIGPSQGYSSGFVLSGQSIGWTLTTQIAQPSISAQRGPGGQAQANTAALIVTAADTSWTLGARLFAARFSYTLAADGFSVQFTSSSGDAPEILAWDFGDGTSGGGTPANHIYSDFATFTATLTVTRSRGFEAAPLASSASQEVVIPATAKPDESIDEVLNIEMGRHAYEPLRVAASDVGDNVSFFNEVLNLSAGQIQTLLFFTPARTIRVRQVTATGTGDGLFKLILNSQVIDAKRSYATQRNVRFDIEEGLKLSPTDTLEVRVTNSSGLTQSYEGALLGRTL